MNNASKNDYMTLLLLCDRYLNSGYDDKEAYLDLADFVDEKKSILEVVAKEASADVEL